MRSAGSRGRAPGRAPRLSAGQRRGPRAGPRPRGTFAPRFFIFFEAPPWGAARSARGPHTHRPRRSGNRGRRASGCLLEGLLLAARDGRRRVPGVPTLSHRTCHSVAPPHSVAPYLSTKRSQFWPCPCFAPVWVRSGQCPCSARGWQLESSLARLRWGCQRPARRPPNWAPR